MTDAPTPDAPTPDAPTPDALTLDDEALRARLAGPLGRLAAPARSPEALAATIRDAALVLALLGPRAPRARDLARSVNRGADAAAALFGGGAATPAPATAELWLTGHALACVGRRSQAIGRLSVGIPAAEEGPHAALARALARWWRQDPAWDEGLDEALDPAPDAALLRAVAGVARAVVARDLDGVDRALAEGLRAHAAWFASRPADPHGRVALLPLGMACLAEGVGLVPRVESERLPTVLVRGSARARPGVVAEPLPSIGAGDGSPTDPEASLARAAELAVQVVPVLRALTTGADLRPHPEDWPRVFRARADEARAAFERAPAPKLVVEAGQTELDVVALPAWAFGVHPAARELPGGYARIRDLLDPDRVWVTARFRRPGASLGVRVDGLVWLGDRWVWIPKPWRLVGGPRG